MNTALRQLFTAVIALFVALGVASTVITAWTANALNADPRNRRALYHEFGAPRGAILAADGSTIARSTPSHDAFSYQRSYADGDLYAPVTGYFSISQRADRGVEASRNRLLSGDADALFWEKIKQLFIGGENQGASIETSIDPHIQRVAYEQMRGKDGAVVVIQPQTGRILAMVSTPSYNPNQLAPHNTTQVNSAYAALVKQPSNPMLNRATSQLYPPGSTFKTVVAAAALESGKYQPDTPIPAGASYTLPGTVTALTNVEAAANGVAGRITLNDALAYSSNTGFAQLGVTLGEQAIAEQARKLGFGTSIVVDGSDATGLPMKAVASGIGTVGASSDAGGMSAQRVQNSPNGQDVQNAQNGTPATTPAATPADKLALASIGQGDVQVTPLQNALIAAAIANHGTLMQPTLVDRVRSSDLSVLSQTRPSVFAEAMSEQTAQKLNEMMQSVVLKSSRNLAIPGVQVAAKTGTAQIGTRNQAVDGWVIGFAPAQNPKVAIAVVVHHVDTLGSYAAGPVMRRVMEEALRR